MSYPAAFCVNCRTHVTPANQHTILMRNQARALTGQCPKCRNDVYRIMAKKLIKDTRQEQKTLRIKYPNGFCFKCHKKVPTTNQRTVVLENNSVAVRGNCRTCHSDVYRILGKKDLGLFKRNKLAQIEAAQKQTARIPAKLLQEAAHSDQKLQAILRTNRALRDDLRHQMRYPKQRQKDDFSQKFTVFLIACLALAAFAAYFRAEIF